MASLISGVVDAINAEMKGHVGFLERDFHPPRRSVEHGGPYSFMYHDATIWPDQLEVYSTLYRHELSTTLKNGFSIPLNKYSCITILFNLTGAIITTYFGDRVDNQFHAPTPKIISLLDEEITRFTRDVNAPENCAAINRKYVDVIGEQTGTIYHKCMRLHILESNLQQLRQRVALASYYGDCISLPIARMYSMLNMYLQGHKVTVYERSIHIKNKSMIEYDPIDDKYSFGGYKSTSCNIIVNRIISMLNEA